jgi:hypothetical protein
VDIWAAQAPQLIDLSSIIRHQFDKISPEYLYIYIYRFTPSHQGNVQANLRNHWTYPECYPTSFSSPPLNISISRSSPRTSTPARLMHFLRHLQNDQRQALPRALPRSTTESRPRRRPSRKRHVRTRVNELWPFTRHHSVLTSPSPYLCSARQLRTKLLTHSLSNTATQQQKGQCYGRVLRASSFPTSQTSQGHHCQPDQDRATGELLEVNAGQVGSNANCLCVVSCNIVSLFIVFVPIRFH